MAFKVAQANLAWTANPNQGLKAHPGVAGLRPPLHEFPSCASLGFGASECHGVRLRCPLRRHLVLNWRYITSYIYMYTGWCFRAFFIFSGFVGFTVVRCVVVT